MELRGFDRWAVQSNLQRIREEGLEVAEVVARLRANGYPTIAAEVERLAEVEPDGSPRVEYVNVNEDGEEYDVHETVEAALAVQRQFPNDSIIVRECHDPRTVIA